MAFIHPPTPEQVAESHRPGIIAANLTVAILATIAVVFRFLARRIQKIGFKTDDISILIALPLAWAVCICTMISVHNGLGKHINTVLPQHLITEGQAYFASEFFWATTILFIKISILSLYMRIFGRLKYIRYLAYGFGIFVTCWAIMVILVVALQCRPIQLVWNKSVNGTCIDAWLFFVVGSSMNVLTDFAILILPLPAVWGLQMGVVQKTSIIGILMLGSLTCIISVVRLSSMIKERNNMDVTWALSQVAIWSTAEPCLGIVAACLPTLRPLFTRYFSLQSSVLARKGSGFGYAKSGSTGENPLVSLRSKDNRPFQPLRETEDKIGSHRYSASAAGETDGDGTKDIPENVIEVNTSWETMRAQV